MLEKKTHEKIQLNSTFFLEQIRRKESTSFKCY